MKKETLERGNELQKKIKEFKRHLEYTFIRSDRPGHEGFNPFEFEYSKKDGKTDVVPNFFVKPFHTDRHRELRNEFVPFPIDKFMKIYKSNVEEEIARLEKEFDSL